MERLINKVSSHPITQKASSTLKTQHSKLTTFIRSRGYSAKTWIAIIAFTGLTVTFIAIGLSIIFTPPIATFHYEPFDSKQEFEQFLKDNPLYTATPPTGQSFTIDRKIRQDKIAEYTFNLTTRPLKPDMSDSYIQSYLQVLTDSQNNALQWIKDNNQDPDNLYIRWNPDPTYMKQSLLNQDDKQNPNKSATPTPTPRPTFSQ